MIDMREILQHFDFYAGKSNFPVLDNANVEIADVRLTAFRDALNWAVIFDFVGYAAPELAFVDDIYAYGSCVSRAGLQGEKVLLSSPPGKPLRDPATNDFLLDWRNWSVLVEGRELSFSPTPEQYAAAGLDIQRESGPGSIKEAEILRFLVHSLGHSFFTSDEELFDFAPACKNLKKLLQTTEWQHPDVARGEIPSQNVALRSLAEAIACGDASLFNPGKPNTHWRYWLPLSGG